MKRKSGNSIRGARSWRSARIALMAISLILGVSALVGSALLTSAQTVTPATTATPEPCPTATPTSGTATDLCVEIGEYDIYFKPNLITIPADTPVRFVLVNHGEATHNFSVTDHENSGLENLNISITNDAGKSDETTINAPAGTYYFFCNQPGHEQAGMRGYITVTKDAKIATSEATVTPRAG